MELQANIPHGSVSSQTIALMTAVYSFYLLRGFWMGGRKVVLLCSGMLRCEFHENGELSRSVKNDDDGLMEYRYGGFLTWVHPQIIHFDWIFLDKSSILGYPHLRTPPVSSNEFGFQR
jgi:hypothetical protein